VPPWNDRQIQWENQRMLSSFAAEQQRGVVAPPRDQQVADATVGRRAAT